MKKCLRMLLILGIAGLCCARGAVVFCAPDAAWRVQQIEKAILREGRALKTLQKRYEDILKRQERLRVLLEQKRRRDRRRVIESTLSRIKRWEAKEKAVRALLGKPR